MSIEAMKQALEALEKMVTPRNFQTHQFCQKAYDDLRQAIAEAEKQEPVAWVHIKDGCLVGSHRKEGEPLPDGQYGLWSIDTQPPKREWVGLTDEEVVNLVDDEDWYNYPEGFVKIVEAKLKEKNT